MNQAAHYPDRSHGWQLGAAFIVCLIAAMLVASSPVGAGQNKTRICHGTSEGATVLIEVADPAAPTHLKHGDGLVGGDVPGDPGFTYDESCRRVAADSDGDGYEGPLGDGTDCDDTDASINPGAIDLPGDGVDQNCDGIDENPAPSHETIDTCSDGIDNDLDTLTDDADSDCFGVSPWHFERLCDDGFDNDLDGATDAEDTDCAV